MKNLLKLKGATILDKKQQGLVVGGFQQTQNEGTTGTCAVQGPDGNAAGVGISKEEAIAWATHWGTHWCCDSCGSASWM